MVCGRAGCTGFKADAQPLQYITFQKRLMVDSEREPLFSSVGVKRRNGTNYVS